MLVCYWVLKREIYVINMYYTSGCCILQVLLSFSLFMSYKRQGGTKKYLRGCLWNFHPCSSGLKKYNGVLFSVLEVSQQAQSYLVYAFGIRLSEHGQLQTGFCHRWKTQCSQIEIAKTFCEHNGVLKLWTTEASKDSLKSGQTWNSHSLSSE